MDFIKKNIIWFLLLISVVFVIIVLKHIFPERNNRVVQHMLIRDTNLRVRYEYETNRDTIIKWYEKILYKSTKPEIVYYQKTDTVFIEKIKELDLMLQIERQNRKLKIKAVNQKGYTIKEYVFDDVNSNFTAVSQKENIFVKSKKFEWNRVNSIFNLQWSLLNSKKLFYNFGIETGINYKNKIDLNAGLLYSPEKKDLFINSELKIKF